MTRKPDPTQRRYDWWSLVATGFYTLAAIALAALAAWALVPVAIYHLGWWALGLPLYVAAFLHGMNLLGRLVRRVLR